MRGDEIDWTFDGTWPFEPRYAETPDGRMHHVDEGPPKAPVVVLLHGNPTWSYLYRRFVPRLVESGYRAVAVDHLGYGRSDKPADPDAYRVPRHAARLGGLLDRLDLQDTVIAAHDWAVPIVLPWVSQRAASVRGLFLFNTFAPRLPGPIGAKSAIRSLRTPLLGSMLVRRGVPIERFLFDAGLANPDVLDARAKDAYCAPFAAPRSRLPLLVAPREIPFRDRGPVAELTQRTASWLEARGRALPAALCWGMQDVLFGDEVLSQWSRLVPHAWVERLDDAGHFVQEDAPVACASSLLRFLDEVF
jgi:pimeloyl-ACP methyl ester carboxylesterase